MRAGAAVGHAHHWWAVGLRSLAAILFALSLFLLPSSAIASLVLLFAAYVTADGLLVIVAAARAARRGQRSRMLILEGVTNLTVAAAVLLWQALAVVPIVPLASAWAVVTGALMLATARRLPVPQERWFLTIAGTISVAWGALLAAAGPSAIGSSRAVGLWLAVYAILFGITLLILAYHLKQRHQLPDPLLDA